MVTRSRSVVLFYRYFPRKISDAVDDLAQWQQSLAQRLELTGRVLVADEGINGTLSGSEAALDAYQRACEAWTVPPLLGGYVRPLRGIDWKRSTSEVDPFPDLVIKRVNQIVAAGNLSYDLENTGIHLTPEDFHAMVTQDRDDVILLDVRNRFENSIGHFVDAHGKPALHPNMRNYRPPPPDVRILTLTLTLIPTLSGFAEYVARHRDDFQGKTVLMYCTGGVRCETASAHIKGEVATASVYQLQGGIHRYLEAFPPEQGGRFHGKNFVFDRRVAMPASASNPASSGIVGQCSECGAPWDELAGAVVCTVCRDMVLVCPSCRESSRHGEWCVAPMHSCSLLK